MKNKSGFRAFAYVPLLSTHYVVVALSGLKTIPGNTHFAVYHFCVIVRDPGLHLTRMKDQHGHWLRWTSTGGKNSSHSTVDNLDPNLPVRTRCCARSVYSTYPNLPLRTRCCARSVYSTYPNLPS